MEIQISPKGIINKCYVPYLFAPQKTRIVFGGSSSGKSVWLSQEYALGVLEGRNTLVARKVAKTIRGSCWNEINKAIYSLGIKHLFDINKSDMTITAKNNGCQFLFVGLDDVEKVKSITPQKGVFTDIWVEEATEIDYEDFKQLEKRLRGQSKHPKRITLSFNPIYKTHWIYTEFFKHWEEGKNVYKDSELLILKTTHEDNEFLTLQDHDRLRNEKDEYYYNVYTLGNWGVLGDVIFKNWRVEDLTEQSKQFDNIRNGLDFGFASDPSAYVRVHLDKMRKKIYVFKEFYEHGMTNGLLAEALRPIIRHERIICDSAEPKSIYELSGLGLNTASAIKGADSIVFGIQWLQGYEIIIDSSCVNLKNELALYQWKKDKNGNTVKQPQDKNNHLIDALRYALCEDMFESVGTAKFSSIRI